MDTNAFQVGPLQRRSPTRPAPASRSAAPTVVGIVVLGLVCGCASVPPPSEADRALRFRHGGDGFIMVSVSDRVATLSGHADSMARFRAQRAVLERDDVDRVVNLVTR